MDNQEILTKAIQKAVDGGWNVFGQFEDGNTDEWEILEMREGLYLSIYTDLSEVDEGKSEIARWHIYEVVFNHNFARALWGEEEVTIDDEEWYTLPTWQYHLQQMVIADDPIKYLGEHLNG